MCELQTALESLVQAAAHCVRLRELVGAPLCSTPNARLAAWGEMMDSLIAALDAACAAVGGTYALSQAALS